LNRQSSIVNRQSHDRPEPSLAQIQGPPDANVTFVCAILVVTPLVLVFYHLVKLGFQFHQSGRSSPNCPNPSAKVGGGMANAIVGTFVCSRQAAVVGVPGRRARRRVPFRIRLLTKLNWWIRFAADVLNGVPSITWGMVVYGLMVVPMHGFSALAGGVVLGLMMIPLVMRTTEEVLQLVPGGYREAALALGIAKWKTIVQIVIRTALKGIVTGVLLALARVAGETAPLLFTAGNLGWAHKLTEPIAAMPLQIYVYAISPYDDWHRQAWAGALVLLLLVLAINVGVRFFTRDRFQQSQRLNLESPCLKPPSPTPVSAGSQIRRRAGPGGAQPVRLLRQARGGQKRLARHRRPGRHRHHRPQRLRQVHLSARTQPDARVEPEARMEGEIKLFGDDIYSRNVEPVVVRRRVGMVFQKSNPFPTMSIVENVTVGLRLNGVRNRKLLAERTEQSLRMAALWDEVKDRLHAPAISLVRRPAAAAVHRARAGGVSRKCCSWTNRPRRSTRWPRPKSRT
jgi:phosphate transport system permease protein